MEIRELTGADASDYLALRLRGLREDPGSFGSSYEEERYRTVEEMAERMRSAPQRGEFALGAFHGNQLVGMVTFIRAPKRKIHHLGTVFGAYIAPEARGKGYGRRLMTALIERARALDGLEQIALSVLVPNPAAQELYRSLGFEVFGLQRRSVKLDGGDYRDEEFMALML
jgi:RimJ/RimL family protein N-acetyltransferase